MTNDHFKARLVELGWRTYTEFAKVIDYRPETVSRWAAGAKPIPRVVELLLRAGITPRRSIKVASPRASYTGARSDDQEIAF